MSAEKKGVHPSLIVKGRYADSCGKQEAFDRIQRDMKGLPIVLNPEKELEEMLSYTGENTAED